MKEAFMREALRLAAQNRDCQGGPFGAVVVRYGQIIGRGQNRVIRDNDPTAHAEIVAIREACRTLGGYWLPGCEIYSSCEPCPMCLSALYWARIERGYYAATQEDAAAAGFADAFLYEELTRPVAQRRLPLLRLLEQEGTIPFQKWAANPSRVPY
jgi:guanine deaminase